jgi:dihydrofolate reductase
MEIVVTEFISLDGVVQSPGGEDEDPEGGFGHGGWQMAYGDDVVGAAIDRGTQRADAFLFGRKTFELWVGHWPNFPDEPFGKVVNPTPKHVVSDTLAESDITWAPTSLIRGAQLVAAVEALRAAPGRDCVVWGSSGLVQSLLAHDLVDRLELFVAPVVLGGGKSIFGSGGGLRGFELTALERATTGQLVTRYERRR